MFPYSIDKLTKESALVTGPKPRIFLNNVVHFEEFLNPVGYVRWPNISRLFVLIETQRIKTRFWSSSSNNCPR